MSARELTFGLRSWRRSSRWHGRRPSAPRLWYCSIIHGSCLDLFAPGNARVSTSNAGDTASQSMNGTPMAAPHAAGSAALLPPATRRGRTP
ncbi:S8 family serine peptidase [Streptomyces sp. E2N166]|uniref:S8 family serine peptidase n=1 Tax=Streptomyces sp. E2N166 TaxID=1851909 RepID=UPI00187D3A26|nr:S8 family serine peptidase [Streptomyces sp. E2N166]